MDDRIPLGDKKRCPPGYKRDPTDRTMCIKNPSSRSKSSSFHKLTSLPLLLANPEDHPLPIANPNRLEKRH